MKCRRWELFEIERKREKEIVERDSFGILYTGYLLSIEEVNREKGRERERERKRENEIINSITSSVSPQVSIT